MLLKLHVDILTASLFSKLKYLLIDESRTGFITRKVFGVQCLM